MKYLEFARRKARLEIELYKAELMKQSQNDIAGYEHDYHKSMEIKKVELAKLDAQIEHKKQILAQDKNTYERIITEKDKVINSLVEVLKKGV